MSKKLFDSSSGNWSVEEFNEAMIGLIAKGLAEKVMIGNREYFQLTHMGEIVGKHIGSDPSTKN